MAADGVELHRAAALGARPTVGYETQKGAAVAVPMRVPGVYGAAAPAGAVQGTRKKFPVLRGGHPWEGCNAGRRDAGEKEQRGFPIAGGGAFSGLFPKNKLF